MCFSLLRATKHSYENKKNMNPIKASFLLLVTSLAFCLITAVREERWRRRLMEADPLKSSQSLLHRCRDAGEAYAAAYLIHKEHLIYHKTDYHLKWVNCEMASFIMMNARASHLRAANGTVLQSVDVLDFSVIHLSTYERLLNRWRFSNKQVNADRNNLDPVIKAAERLRIEAMRLKRSGQPLQHPSLNRTVVIMPYLGSDMGAGHSKLLNRQSYLAACFWSFYKFYPHVTVAVKSQFDYDYVKNFSGLPFYDIMLLQDLPKSASLPVATVQTTKEKIINGTYDFDYVFFTESDQILLMRPVEDLYGYLEVYPRHLLTPHRLMAYPLSVVNHFHNRNLTSTRGHWREMRCCLPRQHCLDRNDWQHVSNTSAVVILDMYGIPVPLGNSNFHAETYRYCNLSMSDDMHYCP